MPHHVSGEVRKRRGRVELPLDRRPWRDSPSRRQRWERGGRRNTEAELGLRVASDRCGAANAGYPACPNHRCEAESVASAFCRDSAFKTSRRDRHIVPPHYSTLWSLRAVERKLDPPVESQGDDSRHIAVAPHAPRGYACFHAPAPPCQIRHFNRHLRDGRRNLCGGTGDRPRTPIGRILWA